MPILALSLVLPVLAIALGASNLILDFFQASKWVALYGATLILLIQSLFCKESLSLPYSRKAVWLFAGGVLLLGISIAANIERSYLQVILDWSCFIITAIFSYNFPWNHKANLKLLFGALGLALVLTMAHASAQSFGFKIFAAVESVLNHAEIVSLYGNKSFAAEFVGLSTVMLIFALQFTKDRKKIFALCGLLAASFIYLYFLSCRAVLLALVANLTLFLIFHKELRRSLVLSLVAGIVGVLLILEIRPKLTNALSIESPRIYHLLNKTEIKEKGRNIQIRLDLWKNTIPLIRDHPLGTGPDSFEFEYVPYHQSEVFSVGESNLMFSPHNGFLEVSVDFGIAFAIYLYGLIFCFLILCFRKYKTKPSIVPLGISFHIFLYLLIVSQFAFPLDNAFVFYVLALGLGMSLKNFQLEEKILSGRLKSAILLSLLIFCCIFVSRFLIAKHYELTAEDNYQQTSTACEAWPALWQVCLRKAEMEYEDNQLLDETETIRKMLVQNPFNFPALNLLAYVYLDRDQKDTACQIFSTYDRILKIKKDHSEFCKTN